MLGFLHRQADNTSVRPAVLHLSGPRLRRALEHLEERAEPTGGIERYVSALVLKSSLFQEILAKGKVEQMSESEFHDLAVFVTPGRRRMSASLDGANMGRLLGAITKLLAGWSDVSTTDERMAAFINTFPDDRAHRWVRDLGAELLHFSAPDHYPLMTRWMWDEKVGTGVLREIWYSEREDMSRIEVDDSFGTFRLLYGELAEFLSENGVYRDMAFHIDLLCAHIYAGYINDQGGAYLRSDFSDGADPMMHTRRMLGLDAIDTETGRTRLKLIDGSAHTIGGESPRLKLRTSPNANS